MLLVFLVYVFVVIGKVLWWLVIGIQCEVFVIQLGVWVVKVWMILVVGVCCGIEFVVLFVVICYVVVEQLVSDYVFFQVFYLFVLQGMYVGCIIVVVVIGYYVGI